MGVPDNFLRWKGLNGVLGFKGHQITPGDQLRPAGWIRRLCRPLHRVELNGKSLLFARTSLLGYPVPEHCFLPDCMGLMSERVINPDKCLIVCYRAKARPNAIARWRSAERAGPYCGLLLKGSV